jgi:hypothetical protein
MAITIQGLRRLPQGFYIPRAVSEGGECEQDKDAQEGTMKFRQGHQEGDGV